MHKSQLAGFIIDCQTDNISEAAHFWSKALGYPIEAPDDASRRFIALETGRNNLHVEVQQVNHTSRVHLDIKTDNVEAEVCRLERLGAKRIQAFPSWCVLEAPTGHRFCVVHYEQSQLSAEA